MAKSKSISVGILMGSSSDRPVVEKAWKVLEDLGVPFEVLVASAHRSPGRVRTYAFEARGRGLKVIIAAAGGAAHLAGVVASHTTLPVIGIPVASSPLAGFDSLLSTVQMPPGIPVATVGVGESGATNAGLLAAAIIAIGDPALAKKLDQYRANQEKKVIEMNDAVQEYLKKK